MIDTESNLNSEVLQEIIYIVGADYTAYASKQNLLDEKLVGYRNRIAHGELFEVDHADYELLYVETLKLIEAIRNDVENAATLKNYRK